MIDAEATLLPTGSPEQHGLALPAGTHRLAAGLFARAATGTREGTVALALAHR